ncbi:hypothetical protein AVEN_127805-1 [Araneus ventricosus]|uniref:Uncharacterized protein n=1 Tax=Araneus ventricosus TaxID=182803 RepID=A0A4Y2DNF1_ARAVE|nr:hypothetical protein AVEN_127805-1 [Araneus ventricosus]
MEEISVQVLESFNDGFLDFGIGSEMATCQVTFQQFGEIQISWCENRSRNRTDAEVQEAVVKWLQNLDTDFFHAGFDKLALHHQITKCFNNYGDYAEK